MKKTASLLFLAVSAAAVCGWATLSHAQPNETQQTTSARLCQINTMEVAAPRTAGGTCVPPYYENEGGLCVTARKSHNAFSYIVNEDGSLDFGLSYWFGSGAHCGIIGTARPTEKGWRYENNMDSADPAARCAVNISIEQDLVVFDADPQAACRSECGAQGYLRNTFIPMSAVESNHVTPDSLSPEKFYNTPCNYVP